MGTFITISVGEDDKNHLENSFKIMSDVEASLSSYNPSSKIYQLNKNKEIELDFFTYEALKLSTKYYRQTDKHFDITVGSITKDLFHFGEEERVPEESELQKAKVSFAGLYISKTKAFIDEGVKVDLGGMGKGYGVDKVVEYLKSQGIDKAIVSASGDIRCLGECVIKVQNPFGDGYLARFEMDSGEVGVSTSGNYNRYVKTKENNHLINPKVKKPQQNFISITLISKLPSADLDAYATAVSVMPVKSAYEFLNTHALAYIIIQSDGELRVSENISEFVKNLVFYNRVEKQPSDINN
ncbi:MAG: FAD:protein FMN transferase [Helicobacteraceae bacterium]|nr:FAD:protein FMN transferase [Candidatus Sulfurimonas ponti]